MEHIKNFIDICKNRINDFGFGGDGKYTRIRKTELDKEEQRNIIRIEEHKRWAREVFDKNKPTDDYLTKLSKNLNKDDDVVYASFNKQKHDIIGRILIRKQNETPEYSNIYENNVKITTATCHEVYNMMKELNEMEGWKLKVKNNCDNSIYQNVRISW